MRQPLFPAASDSPEMQRLLAGTRELLGTLFRSGGFLQRLVPGRLYAPTGTVMNLAWGEMNRVPPGNVIARLPQILPELIGTPLQIMKGSPVGTVEVQPGGVGVDGKTRPTVDGNAFGIWLNEAGARQLFTDGNNWFTSRPGGNTFLVYNVLDYGASPSMSAATNRRAIQAAITAAVAAGGGAVLFPGGPGTFYSIDAQLLVPGSNILLWFPGNAGLRIAAPIQVMIAVGDIETGANQAQGNTLAANSLAGSQSVTLTAGKGANITAGDWMVILSDAVIPEHDAAVFNKRAEFVNVYARAGDVLSLAAPLRYDYNTADNAQVYVINWVENFAIAGMRIDGNNQTQCPIAVQMSWCLKPTIFDVGAVDLQQRFLRFQGCLKGRVDSVRQENGLSNGFNGDVGHFAYMIAEQGLNEGLIATNLQADRVRHGYTTGQGWTNNNATGATLDDISVPMNSTIGPGTHINSRGAGWDTHEVGVDITFQDLKTLGSLELGFQVRSVRTRFTGDCYARDCVGSALQIGSDAQDTIVERLDWQNTNLGTTSIDWTKFSPIVDNSPRSFLGQPQANVLDNGNFDLWEHGTSFTADGGTANRWHLALGSGAGVTVTQRSHASDSSGAQSTRFYLRFNRTTTGSGASSLRQYIGDVRTLAGQRVSISFDARDSVDGSDINVYVRQYFGTGGAPSADVDSTISVRTVDGTWRRRNLVIDIPSITTKTIGSNEDSACILIIELPTAAGAVFIDLDRVKLEVGRMPTTFTPEPIADTAERCHRWAEKSYLDDVAPGSSTSVGAILMASPSPSANFYRTYVPFTTRKGSVPTVAFFATVGGASGFIRNVSSGINIPAAVTASVGQNGFYGGATNSSGIGTGIVTAFQWAAQVPNYY